MSRDAVDARLNCSCCLGCRCGRATCDANKQTHAGVTWTGHPPIGHTRHNICWPSITDGRATRRGGSWHRFRTCWSAALGGWRVSPPLLLLLVVPGFLRRRRWRTRSSLESDGGDGGDELCSGGRSFNVGEAAALLLLLLLLLSTTATAGVVEPVTDDGRGDAATAAAASILITPPPLPIIRAPEEASRWW